MAVNDICKRDDEVPLPLCVLMKNLKSFNSFIGRQLWPCVPNRYMALSWQAETAAERIQLRVKLAYNSQITTSIKFLRIYGNSLKKPKNN